ncbi:MAG: sigma factor-like helix-turn-helix DNA-binding protein [Actinomycetota bacterium]
MPLDLCLEASGSVAHFLAADAAQARLPLRWRRRRSSRRNGQVGAAELGPDTLRAVDRGVASAIDRLPFLLANVLWLIDVCRCSYETAAVELGVSPERVQALVVEARERIRHDVSVIEAVPRDRPPVRRRRARVDIRASLGDQRSSSKFRRIQ